MYGSAGGEAEIMTRGICSLLLKVSSLQLKRSELLGAAQRTDCCHFGPGSLNISEEHKLLQLKKPHWEDMFCLVVWEER